MVLIEQKIPIEKLITYEVTGPSPHYMFFSGIHGDEGSICGLLDSALNHRPDSFPSSLKLLRANRPALKLNKRGVGDNKIIDANRYFNDGEKGDWIAREIKEVMVKHPEIEYVFSFHEETDKNGYQDKEGGGIETFERDPDSFYMYDAFNADESSVDEILPFYNSLISSLTENGFTLYTGYDDYTTDRNETVQLNPVVNGYCPQPSNRDNFIDGSFENWVIDQGIKRSFLFEIPHGLSIERKKEMIQIIFKKFIIPFLNQVYDLNFPDSKTFSF